MKKRSLRTWLFDDRTQRSAEGGGMQIWDEGGVVLRPRPLSWLHFIRRDATIVFVLRTVHV